MKTRRISKRSPRNPILVRHRPSRGGLGGRSPPSEKPKSEIEKFNFFYSSQIEKSKHPKSKKNEKTKMNIHIFYFLPPHSLLFPRLRILAPHSMVPMPTFDIFYVFFCFSKFRKNRCLLMESMRNELTETMDLTI